MCRLVGQETTRLNCGERLQGDGEAVGLCDAPVVDYGKELTGHEGRADMLWFPCCDAHLNRSVAGSKQ